MLFVLPIILFDYSQKVSLLFQFGVPIIKDVTFILKGQFICGCIVALQKVKYNPLVPSFAFEKKCFPIVTRLSNRCLATLPSETRSTRL